MLPSDVIETQITDSGICESLKHILVPFELRGTMKSLYVPLQYPDITFLNASTNRFLTLPFMAVILVFNTKT